MNKLVKTGSQVLAFAALLAFAGAEAQAQDWPTTAQRRCNWTRTDGPTTIGGTAKVTFTYSNYVDPNNPYHRQGTLRTEYPNGQVNLSNFDIYWDWPSGSYSQFVYTQPNGLSCHYLDTFEGGNIVVWDTCQGTNSSGVPFQTFQYCRQ
jgi:hypothetical protein